MTAAPTICFSDLKKFGACAPMRRMYKEKFSTRERLDAKMALTRGVKFNHIIWVAERLSLRDENARVRFQCWNIDCVIMALPIYGAVFEVPRELVDVIECRKRLVQDHNNAALQSALETAIGKFKTTHSKNMANLSRVRNLYLAVNQVATAAINESVAHKSIYQAVYDYTTVLGTATRRAALAEIEAAKRSRFLDWFAENPPKTFLVIKR